MIFKKYWRQLLFVSVLLTLVGVRMFIENNHYKQAIAYIEQKNYDEAINILNTLGKYKDSSDIVKDVTYEKSIALSEDGEFDMALETLETIKDYYKYDEGTNEVLYKKGNFLLEHMKYDEAVDIFNKLKDYKNSLNLLRIACIKEQNLILI